MSDRISDGEERGESRFRTEVAMSIRERGSHQMPATLYDLSCTGCRVVGVRLSRNAGNDVYVRIPGLESLAASVAWSDDSTYGLWFERALHPAVFQRIATLHRQFPTAENDDSAALLPAPRTQAAVSRPGGSRRDQIKAGYVVPDHGMLLEKRPLDGGKSIMTLVRRHTARKADHRAEPRFAAPSDVDLTVGRDRARLSVENLSSSGLMASGEAACELGDRVEMRFAGYEPICGTVIWKRGDQIGVSLPPNSIDLADAA